MVTSEFNLSWIEEKDYRGSIREWIDYFKGIPKRDPKRIEEVLTLLKEIWERVPDWRFFQLIENIFGCPRRQNRCFFYQEDDITIQRLRHVLGMGVGATHE